MSKNDTEKAWDWFRDIVGLAKGAEEHAAVAEREACCYAVMNDSRDKDDMRDSDDAFPLVTRHSAAAKRHFRAASRYRDLLRDLAESTGNERAAEYLRNCEHHIERAKIAAARARDAEKAVVDLFAGTPANVPVCWMVDL